MTATKNAKELAIIAREATLFDSDREAIAAQLERLARIEEATADLVEIRREHEQDRDFFTIDQPHTEIEKLHNTRGVLLDLLAKQALQLTVSRDVTDKTAIERDRYHDELVQAQAKILRVAMAIENPDFIEQIRRIAAAAECSPVKCHRIAEEVVGLLRLALNPKAKP